MTSKKINIIIAEQSPIIYEGISNLLLKRVDYFNIHKADNPDEIRRINNHIKTDTIIINPGLIQNNSELLNNLRKELEQTVWIGLVYSYYDENLLSKFDELIHINDSPEKIISTIIKQQRTRQDDESENGNALSKREIEVLKLLVKGLSAKEIADQLNISTHTVITHRKNISEKTAIKSISGLTIYAVVKQIISLENYNL